MAQGQNPKCFIMEALQPSTLTLSVDHTVLVEGKGSTTRFKSSYRQENKGGNPEYL